MPRYSPQCKGKFSFLDHGQWLILLSLVICITWITDNTALADDSAKNVISGINVEQTDTAVNIRILGSMEPAYTVYELPNPDRIIIEVANSKIANSAGLKLPRSVPATMTTKLITDTDPPRNRFEFAMTKSLPFTVKRDNNDIVIALDTSSMEPPASRTQTAQINPTVDQQQNIEIENKLPKANTLAATHEPALQQNKKTAGEALKDSFSFAGYNKKRITVDFYKIDLHNVFRLLREISKTNIVVDDSVSGSLTLALNDVPWDFALDIILNLKDLQKEERYNTIVILPKSKNFSWPQRAEDNLRFEADENMAAQQAIVIQQKMNIPPAVIKAKKLIKQALEFEKNESYDSAIQKYEAAFAKWPDNERLADKIATINLVYLRQNAKAVYYAKKALEINPDNGNAALNAAIALANMQENIEAQQYFDQSISIEKPSREALLSYAAFSEGRNQYDAALKLLAKHHLLYGDNLDSMIAEARILDKQGRHEMATDKYKSILLSGYHVPPDLKKYIKSRIALSQSM